MCKIFSHFNVFMVFHLPTNLALILAMSNNLTHPNLFPPQGLPSPGFSKTGFQKSYHEERLLSPVRPPSVLTGDDCDLGLAGSVRAKAAFERVPGLTELDLFGRCANC